MPILYIYFTIQISSDFCAFQLDFWSDTDIMIPPSLLADTQAMLDSVDMYYNVHMENVQE